MPHVGLGETAWAAQTPAPTEHHKMISFTFKALAYLHTYLEKRVRLLAFFFFKRNTEPEHFCSKILCLCPALPPNFKLLSNFNS